MSDPKAPKSLGVAGRALWRAVVAGYDLDATELCVLELAAQAADDAANARIAITRDGVTVAGLHGPIIHPAVPIARQAETSVSRLLGQIDVVNRTAKPGRHSGTPGPKPALRRIG